MPTVNKEIRLDRVAGNLESIAARALDNNGDVVDLTGKTILFRQVAITSVSSSTLNRGEVIIDDATATIDSASLGQMSYTYSSAASVNSKGTYAMYFVDDASTDVLYPYDGAKFILNVIGEA